MGEERDERRPENDIPVSRVSIAGRHPSLPGDIARELTAEEQASFFYTLIDSASDAIIVHRPDGTVVYANEGAQLLLGYTADEMLELRPYQWVAPSLLQGTPRRIETILHDGALCFESGANRSDGAIIPTEVKSRRVDTALGPMIVAVIRDVSARRRALEKLEDLALHDMLTGLSNRSHLHDRLAIAIAGARSDGDLLGVAYVDLDDFKPVNDRYGHAVGDEVLVEVARRLHQAAREHDTVARLGGDEFVIALPRLSDESELEGVAARVVALLGEPILADGHVVNIRACVGLAMFADDDDPQSLIVKADCAMYAAKHDAERHWCMFDENMRQTGYLPLEPDAQ